MLIKHIVETMSSIQLKIEKDMLKVGTFNFYFYICL